MSKPVVSTALRCWAAASALEQERQTGKTILFPVRLDDAVLTAPSGWPRLLRNTRNIGAMRAWNNPDAYRRAFARLLRDLRAEGAAPAPNERVGGVGDA